MSDVEPGEYKQQNSYSPEKRSRSRSNRSRSNSHSSSRSRKSATPRRSYSRSRSRSRRSNRSRSRSHNRRREYSQSPSRHNRNGKHSRSRSRSYSRGRTHDSRSPMSSRKRHIGDRIPMAQKVNKLSTGRIINTLQRFVIPEQLFVLTKRVEFELDPPRSRCLGVFGLSLYTNDSDLRSVFSRYGRIDTVNIVIDQKTGRSRGFGFVYYDSREDAEEAKQRANGMELDGRRIRVDFSITKRPHTPTPGVYVGRPYRAPPRGGGSGGGGEDRHDYHEKDRYESRDRYRDDSRRDSYRRSPSPYSRRRSPSPYNRRRSPSPYYRDSYRDRSPYRGRY